MDKQDIRNVIGTDWRQKRCKGKKKSGKKIICGGFELRHGQAKRFP
jgi:hypothetical protein